jgi:hypothetical protein
MFAMFYFIFLLVRKADETIERLMRVLASVLGLLLFLGGKSSGVSIPALMLGSIDLSGGLLSNLILYLVPGISGGLITYLLFRSIKNSKYENNKVIYFLILLSTLTALIFTDIYLTSSNKGANIAINISFISGIIILMLFKIDLVKSLYEVILNKRHKSNIEDHNSNDTKKSWKDQY